MLLLQVDDLRVLLRSCLHGVCMSGELVEWVVDESEVSEAGGLRWDAWLFDPMLNECARRLAL